MKKLAIAVFLAIAAIPIYLGTRDAFPQKQWKVVTAHGKPMWITDGRGGSEMTFTLHAYDTTVCVVDERDWRETKVGDAVLCEWR